MRTKYHKHKPWLRLLCAPLLLSLLAACGPSKAQATPTLSVDAIYTAAFQTLEAQQATNIALPRRRRPPRRL